MPVYNPHPMTDKDEDEDELFYETTMSLEQVTQIFDNDDENSDDFEGSSK